MSIDLPSEFAAFVQSAVQSGGFRSETDVVVAGLRLLQEQQDDKFEELKSAIKVGMDELARGERISADEVFADVRRELSAASTTRPS